MCHPKLLTLTVVVFLCSCVDNSTLLLTGTTDRYWDVMQSGERKFDKPSYCFMFSKDGTCIYYSYRVMPNHLLKRIKFDYGDVIYPNTWQLLADTLQVQGFNYRSKFVGDSMIILVNKQSQDSLILKRSNVSCK